MAQVRKSSGTYLRVDGESGQLYSVVIPYSDPRASDPANDEQFIRDGLNLLETKKGKMWVRYYRATDLGYVSVKLKTVDWSGGAMEIMDISVHGDNGEVIDTISFPFTGSYGLSRYGQIIAKLVENIDPATKYEISFSKRKEGDRVNYSIFLCDEEKNYLKYAYNKDNLPQPKKSTDFKGKETWDYAEVDAKLYQVVTDCLPKLSKHRFSNMVAARQPVNPPKPAINAEPDVHARTNNVADDLPF